MDADDTKNWIERQNEVTFSYLENTPMREALRSRMTQLFDYSRYSTPRQQGGHLFYEENSGLQDQPILYVQPAGGDAESARALIDPNTLSDDGTVALGSFVPSPDGRYVAYTLSESGSDWRTVRIRNVETGEDLPETLEWVKFNAPVWNADGNGFYYGRYPEPASGDAYEAKTEGQKLFFHELNTPQSDDSLIFARSDDPEIGFQSMLSDDGRYLFIHGWKGTAEKNLLYVKDLREPDATIQPVIDTFESSYQVVGNDGSTVFILTNNDAPNRRLVSLDLNDLDAGLTTLIPQSEAVIQTVERAADQFLVHALVDVKARLTVHDLGGMQQREVELPTIGSIGDIDASPDRSRVFYEFTSFTYPSTIYRADLADGRSEVFRQPELPDFDADRYVVKQSFYESKDGTDVPMFIVHKKGMEMSGMNPTLLYGYGGFNVSLTPRFSVSRLLWMEMGGVYAVPNLRGGGEYGQAWHEAGMLDKKQNVFDDFAAAAEYLIDEGYTSRKKLAIAGGSNGGLLTGASITQRPDLFGAAVVSVGVLDMLRFHTFTIGWAWVSEYGSSEDPEQFDFLYDYSPLHNIEDGTAYPPTIITTADTDDRVVPAHSYKFAARLQEAQGGDAPILLRVETKAGHGGGKPISKIIEEQADVYAFLARVLDANKDTKGALTLPSAPGR
jgi:prolyl oligopeptidase